MNKQAKVYSIKLTDLKNDKVTTLVTTENLNFINFHFRSLLNSQTELKTCDYLADIDEKDEGIIETIGITEIAYLNIITKFKNMRKDKII
jgi:hypothetical protein